MIALLLTAFTMCTRAQEVSKDDSLKNEIELIKNDVQALKKLKISGYIQTQVQFADSMGIGSFAGGNFPAVSDKRIGVRRGRIKFDYSKEFTQLVLQFDITEKGFATKDAYLKVTEPKLQCFSLTAGVFNRPFGYEIGYSSSQRESPERARVTQTLFPGERDLGAMITFQPPKTSRYNFIKIDGGMFCGNGINAEFDRQKDFIGRAGISKSTKNEKIKYGLGISYYNGGVFQGTKYIYNMWDLKEGIMGFSCDSTSTNKGAEARREYVGADMQFSIETPIGITTVRAEYVQGAQPGTASSSSSPNSSSVPTDNIYKRNCNGFLGYFTQNIGNTPLQVVGKYDWYDPNTQVAGKDIAAKITAVDNSSVTTKLSSADIKYTTLGVGLIYKFDQNFKAMVYYDMVTNETTGLTKYTRDLKDNVLTFRLQYKF